MLGIGATLEGRLPQPLPLGRLTVYRGQLSNSSQTHALKGGLESWERSDTILSGARAQDPGHGGLAVADLRGGAALAAPRGGLTGAMAWAKVRRPESGPAVP